MVRKLVALLSTLALAACGNAPDPHGPSLRHDASLNAPVEFLLTSAINDFRAHRPPYPARFRDARIGYVAAPDGTRQYMLCGAFLPVREAGEPEWTPFATIQTSGYEQWLGAQAAGFCGSPSIVWVEGDFSSSLQSRLDSRR